MSKQPLSPVNVRVFVGIDIAQRLRPILQLLDSAYRLADLGHPDMHKLNKRAAIELHDLLAEVSE